MVGIPHDIKGQAIYAFVTILADAVPSDTLKNNLTQVVRESIGPIATPEAIQFADALPKTRSGKIMRRILRKIAAHDVSDLGDISTLAEPQVVQELITARAGQRL